MYYTALVLAKMHLVHWQLVVYYIVFYLSNVLQEGSLVTTEFDPLWPRKAVAGLHSFIL